MITFKQFINEEEKPQDLRQFLKENCKFYCDQADIDLDKENFYKDALFRGMNSPPSSAVPTKIELYGKIHNSFIITPRADRKPLHTSKDTNQILDDYFEKHFGVKYRKGLFCTGKFNDTRMYGKPYAIFPMGEFTFMWSPKTSDMFIHDSKISRMTPEEIEEYLNRLDFSEENLIAAIKSNNEISIICKKYLAIEL